MRPSRHYSQLDPKRTTPKQASNCSIVFYQCILRTNKCNARICSSGKLTFGRFAMHRATTSSSTVQCSPRPAHRAASRSGSGSGCFNESYWYSAAIAGRKFNEQQKKHACVDWLSSVLRVLHIDGQIKPTYWHRGLEILCRATRVKGAIVYDKCLQ